MTKVFAYHALSTGGANAKTPRGLMVEKEPFDDATALAAACKAKGVDGVLLWNFDGFDDNGDMPIDGVVRCHTHEDPRVRKWGAQTERLKYLMALDAAGIDWIWYTGFVPIAWSGLTVEQVAQNVRTIFDWLFAYQRTVNPENPVKLAIDNSGGKSADSTDWLVRDALRRRRVNVGCEPTAHVGTPWVNYAAFSVITASLWSKRGGWYPPPGTLNHTEYVLCVGPEFDNAETARMHYQRGAVPCITLDKPWGAADVRREKAA